MINERPLFIFFLHAQWVFFFICNLLSLRTRRHSESTYPSKAFNFLFLYDSVCLFVCFDHRLFTPASTPKGVDFCMHGRLYSRRKGSCAPSSGRSRDEYLLMITEQQRVLMGLPTGLNRLNSHMHRKLKLVSSPTFNCTKAGHTVERILQSCHSYQAARLELWPRAAPLLIMLYGSHEDLEKTTRFIAQTELYE